MGRTLIYAVIIIGTIVADCAGYVLYAALTNPPRNTINAESMTDDRYTDMPDPRLGAVTRPNLVVDDQRISGHKSSIYTDDRGARRDSANERAPASVDLMTIGCSQAFGSGIQNEQTFTSLVARKFGLRAANYAVPGYGGVGSLLRLRERLDQHPKVVIYGFWEDHLNRNVQRCAAIDAPLCLELGRVAFDKNGNPNFVTPEHPERNFELSRNYYRQTTSDSDRWRTLWTDMFWTGMRMWQEGERNLGVLDPGEEMSLADRIRIAKFVLGEMKKTADAGKFQLIVVYIPIYFDPVVNYAPAELESFAREAGIKWISMTQRLNEFKRDVREFTMPNDGHLNALGHTAIAEEVEKVLVRYADGFPCCPLAR